MSVCLSLSPSLLRSVLHCLSLLCVSLLCVCALSSHTHTHTHTLVLSLCCLQWWKRKFSRLLDLFHQQSLERRRDVTGADTSHRAGWASAGGHPGTGRSRSAREAQEEAQERQRQEGEERKKIQGKCSGVCLPLCASGVYESLRLTW